MNSTDLDYAQRRVLRDIQSALRGVPHLRFVSHNPTGAGPLVVVDLDTAPFERAEGGLPVEATERLYMLVPSVWPSLPPLVEVDHQRWDGHPHVLQGRRLCLFLDPAEWNPSAGMTGFFERLWDWFADAIANRFDAATALYHPVGGVLHRTEGAPTVVVTHSLAHLSPGFQVCRILLQPRTPNRVDVVAWNRNQPSENSLPGVLVTLSDGLPRGGGSYLSELAVAIRGQDARHQRRQFISTLSKTSRQLDPDEHLYVIIGVPNRHLTGEGRLHLVGWRLPQSAAEAALHAAARRHTPDDPHPEDEPQVEWTYIDDTRPALNTRRDSQRPVTWLAGKTIELWGCGALGSWIAEHLVRAGVRTIILRDNGYVTKGLLVRQNYTELDVGERKVDALARRIEALSDQVRVVSIHGLAQQAANDVNNADVLIDCTVNTSVAVTIEENQASGRITIPAAQVATDNDTATLAILTVTSGDSGETTNQIDRVLQQTALARPDLRPFRTFWDPNHHAPLTPTLGCSVPTFNGSSADSCAIASSAVTLAAHALSRSIATGYLLASPHTPYDVPPVTRVPIASATSP